MNDLVHLCIKCRIFIRQVFGEVLLVDTTTPSGRAFNLLYTNAHFLGCLICPKAQGSSSTLHDSIGIQSTKNTRFVVFSWVEVRDNNIIWVGEDHVTGRADGAQPFALSRELAAIRAVEAKDMAIQDQLWEESYMGAGRQTCKL